MRKRVVLQSPNGGNAMWVAVPGAYTGGRIAIGYPQLGVT